MRFFAYRGYAAALLGLREGCLHGHKFIFLLDKPFFVYYTYLVKICGARVRSRR